MIISELLQASYPYRWFGINLVKFKTSANDMVAVEFTESAVWGISKVEFNRNGSLKMTYEGDAFKIFATVVKIIKEWLNKSHDGIAFESISINLSRVSLYNRLATKIADELGLAYRKLQFTHTVCFLITMPDEINLAAKRLITVGCLDP